MEPLNKFTVWAIYSMYFAKSRNEYMTIWVNYLKSINLDREFLVKCIPYAAEALDYIQPRYIKIENLKEKMSVINKKLENLNKRSNMMNNSQTIKQINSKTLDLNNELKILTQKLNRLL